MTFARDFHEYRERREAERRLNLKLLATTPARTLHRATMEGGTTGPDAKEKTARSTTYRRRVAELACILCHKPGPSQCAHPNAGKGMGIKASDLECFPLCPDCHREFDQGALFTKAERREIEQRWAAQTRKQLEG